MEQKKLNKMIPTEPTKDWCCPNCGRTGFEMDYKTMKYEPLYKCKLCGQRLEWGDE